MDIFDTYVNTLGSCIFIVIYSLLLVHLGYIATGYVHMPQMAALAGEATRVVRSIDVQMRGLGLRDQPIFE